MLRARGGLRHAVEGGVDDLEVVSDSELLVKQMRGEYRVKNKDLQWYSLEAARLGREIGVSATRTCVVSTTSSPIAWST